jgi:hypothetical protein
LTPDDRVAHCLSTKHIANLTSVAEEELAALLRFTKYGDHIVAPFDPRQGASSLVLDLAMTKRLRTKEYLIGAWWWIRADEEVLAAAPRLRQLACMVCGKAARLNGLIIIAVAVPPARVRTWRFADGDYAPEYAVICASCETAGFVTAAAAL